LKYGLNFEAGHVRCGPEEGPGDDCQIKIRDRVCGCHMLLSAEWVRLPTVCSWARQIATRYSPVRLHSDEGPSGLSRWI